MLGWLLMFIFSMSFMDHRRDVPKKEDAEERTAEAVKG